MKKLLLKHHKLMLIVGCIGKNIATAIAFENMIISGFIGLITGIMIKYHLLEEHLHIKHIKPMEHQIIPINPDDNNEVK